MLKKQAAAYWNPSLAIAVNSPTSVIFTADMAENATITFLAPAESGRSRSSASNPSVVKKSVKPILSWKFVATIPTFGTSLGQFSKICCQANEASITILLVRVFLMLAASTNDTSVEKLSWSPRRNKDESETHSSHRRKHR